MISVILHDVLQLIDSPQKWTRGHFAIDNKGNEVSVDQGVRFCTAGAIKRSAKDNKITILQQMEVEQFVELFIKDSTGIFGITNFNDESTHKDVIKVLDQAQLYAEACYL